MLNQVTIERFHQFVSQQFTSDEESKLEKLGAICQHLDPELKVLMAYDDNVRRAAIELRECHDSFGEGQLPESDWQRVVDVCRVIVTAVSTEGWLAGYHRSAIYCSDTVH